MTFEKMNSRAARREPLPDALLPSERTAYLALCLLYELHSLGRIGRADGARLKAGLAQELANMQARERKWIAAETVLKAVRRSECPAAKALLRGIESEMESNGNDDGKSCPYSRSENQQGRAVEV